MLCLQESGLKMSHLTAPEAVLLDQCVRHEMCGQCCVFTAAMVPCIKQWPHDKEQILTYHPLGTQLFLNSFLGTESSQLCVVAIQSCCMFLGSLKASASLRLVLSSSLYSLVEGNNWGGCCGVPICLHKATYYALSPPVTPCML